MLAKREHDRQAMGLSLHAMTYEHHDGAKIAVIQCGEDWPMAG
jgi:hypothetical protein